MFLLSIVTIIGDGVIKNCFMEKKEVKTGLTDNEKNV